MNALRSKSEIMGPFALSHVDAHIAKSGDDILLISVIVTLLVLMFLWWMRD